MKLSLFSISYGGNQPGCVNYRRAEPDMERGGGSFANLDRCSAQYVSWMRAHGHVEGGH